ncbi:hypothetical protein PMJ71_000187 [Escherichia coli]|nr:hypothetical protein [Escherichia coli]
MADAIKQAHIGMVRDGLPGRSVVARDGEGRNAAIDGECIRINATDVALVDGQ